MPEALDEIRDVDIKLDGGKYHIIADIYMKNFRALRHGKKWRDLTGDNLIANLCYEINDLKATIEKCGGENCLLEEENRLLEEDLEGMHMDNAGESI